MPKGRTFLPRLKIHEHDRSRRLLEMGEPQQREGGEAEDGVQQVPASPGTSARNDEANATPMAAVVPVGIVQARLCEEKVTKVSSSKD